MPLPEYIIGVARFYGIVSYLIQLLLSLAYAMHPIRLFAHKALGVEGSK